VEGSRRRRGIKGWLVGGVGFGIGRGLVVLLRLFKFSGLLRLRILGWWLMIVGRGMGWEV